ncbi:hypothetical protein HGM15179_012104 [Zosterops borbonicus]|uniref:Uncharacterized protein n=1 Tax=Zosterops borbonicus TaxID=364589 RepID=A0A8K1GAG1_9PASS|nr:hypothetical protein HGM15179_012104 [Zosterops borbonicus]
MLHLECYMYLWDPQHKKDADLMEQDQRRAIKTIWVLENFSYEDSLRELEFFSLEKRRLQQDFIAAFQYLKVSCKKVGEELFTWSDSDRVKENNVKLREKRFKLDVRKEFLTQ